MSNYSSADLSMTCHARVASDGKRILCDKRNQCSGVLGEIATVSQSYQPVECSEIVEIEGTVIVLPDGISSQRNGTWRKTKRPDWRGQKNFLKFKGQLMKFKEKPATFWGADESQVADYILPVPVVCPRCKRVNLITDALLPRP